MIDTSDRKSVRRAEKLEKTHSAQEAQVIVQLCATFAGRRWVWNRLSEAHVFHSSFSSDALAMAFAEGQRNQGLRLLDMLMQHCPDHFTLMMKECANDRYDRNDSAERPGSEDGGRDASEPELDLYDGRIDDDGRVRYDAD